MARFDCRARFVGELERQKFDRPFRHASRGVLVVDDIEERCMADHRYWVGLKVVPQLIACICVGFSRRGEDDATQQR